MKYLDLIDKNIVEDGSVPLVNNLIHKSPVMEDANIMPCNKGSRHVVNVVNGLPVVSWGRLYKGVEASKGHRTQITESTGFMESRCEVDTRLLDLCKDGASAATLRSQEAMLHNEAMAQEFTRKFFYGSTATDPDQVRGLANRYSIINSAESHPQVIDAGGTGADNTSIWMVGFGDTKTSIIYPDAVGIGAGIERKDLGQEFALDENNQKYYVKAEMFTMHMGVCVANYRHVVRIANIDMSEVRAGNVDLYALMRQAYYRLGDRSSDYKVYCNTDVLEALDAEATNGTNGDNYTRLRYKEVEGEEVTMYRKFQIRELDPFVLLNTEAQVLTV